MDPRINRTKNLLKSTLKDELEFTTFNEITVTQICSKSTINKTTFYRHYKDLYDLYKDVLTDIFNEGIDLVYKDYSVFFTDPCECFLLNIDLRKEDVYQYFRKQLRESPVELFDHLYIELLSARIYENNLLIRSDINDLKLETAIKALRNLLQENSGVSVEVRADIWKGVVEALFKEECNLLRK